MARPADVVIIGAGVMGASIAYHLAARRAGRIVVLEKSGVAAGASGVSSGLVRMHYAFPPEVRLAVKSFEYFQNWSELLGRPGHIRQTGFVRIVPRSQCDLLRANVAMQQECGADARIVTRAELAEMEPRWNLDDVEVAAFEASSGYDDGALVATDFLDRARELGVEYRPQTDVRSLWVKGGRAIGVTTDSGDIDAGIVVVAAGVWSRALFDGIGLELPLEPEHHEVLILQRPTELSASHLTAIDSVLDIYFRPEGATHTLVGFEVGERGLGPDDEPPPSSQDSLAAKAGLLARRVPAMKDAGLVRTVRGIYTMTPDRRALMGGISSVTGLYCCTGFSGMGFKLAPAVGLAMAELVVDGRSHTVDISAFYPERFARGEPIRPPQEYPHE
jgi:sarcosine oxidase subunit beta